MDEKTLTFIARAKEVHGNQYSYEKTVYLGSKIKVIITCSKHGDFEQAPSNHYKSKCLKCSSEEKNKAKIEKAASEYLAKVKIIHREKYNLSKINYTGSSNKIIVGCASHGDFEIAAKHFLSGSGCKMCGKQSASFKIIERAKQDFVAKACHVHNNEYQYTLAKYTGYTQKLIITCPIHGDFKQTPRKHLEGSGCHQCAIDNAKTRLTTGTYIERAKNTHSSKYDYSKTIFTKSHEKIIIICPFHGQFLQNPHNHLSGAGCKKCADEALIKTNDDFIRQANIKHCNFYSYERTEYQSAKDKVDIFCPTHGYFRQRPTLHLLGYGCNKCGSQKRAKANAHSTSQFIEDANFIHDHLWGYGKTQYKNNHTKVTITCDIHGDFEQVPYSHKSGKGCPICGATKAVKSRAFSDDFFIEKAKLVHEDRYVYDLVEYSHTHGKVAIKCMVHGVFNQMASSHLRGSGCPTCAGQKISKTLSMPFDIFKDRANLVHDHKYNYSPSGFSNLGCKIKIHCLQHGEFEQSAGFHLRGGKCPKCSQVQNRIQTNEFIDRAVKVHFDRYNYESVNCNGGDSVIDIKCNKHGFFKQKAFQHLKGSGCRACYVDSTKSNLEEFLSECRIKHNNKYSYEKAEYLTIRDKVIITCNEHGDFSQTAHDHKHGGGCPRCAEYNRNLDNKDPGTPCYLYYITLQVDSLIFYKIGITVVVELAGHFNKG